MSNIFKANIVVDGIIGSGKSTFSKKIGKRLGFRILEEPVDETTTISNPYLPLFYKDPKRWAFAMQIYLLHQRYAIQQLAAYECLGVGGYKGVIADRGLFGDKVFAKLHKDAGNIEEIDWQTYETAFAIMHRSLLPPSLLIFLDVKPETAFNRMKKRNRGVEAGVPLEYLTTLRAGYEELICKGEAGKLPWLAAKIYRLPFDNDITSETEWDEIAMFVENISGTIEQ